MNLYRYITYPFRAYRKHDLKKKLGHLGSNSVIDSPLRLQGSENIRIGNNVGIHYKTWLAAEPLTNMGGGKSDNLRWLHYRGFQSYMGNSFNCA